MDRFILVDESEAVEKGYPGAEANPWGEYRMCLYETDGEKPIRLVAKALESSRLQIEAVTQDRREMFELLTNAPGAAALREDIAKCDLITEQSTEIAALHKRLAVLIENGSGLRHPDKIVPSPDGCIIIAWVDSTGTQITFECDLDADKLRRALAALPEMMEGA